MTSKTPAKKKKFFDLVATSSVDPAALEDGKWFTGTQITTQPGLDCRFKLRSLGSERIRDLDRQLVIKYRAFADEKGVLPPDAVEAQANERIAACIVDWEDIGLDGVELPYSPEAALKLISDPRMIRIRAGIYLIVNNLDLYRGEVIKEIEGN
jgi:hypothetical protein